MTHRPSNQEIAHHLSLVSQLLALDGQSFPSKAFSVAAEVVSTHQGNVAKMDDVQTISGVGPSIAVTISEFVTSGVSQKFAKLTVQYPAEALTMTVVPGIGPRTALKLHASGIRDLTALVAAARAGKLEEKLKKAVLFSQRAQSRIPLPLAKLVGNKMRDKILELGGPSAKVELAGSIRRGRETVKDIDLIVFAPSRSHNLILRYFRGLGQVLVSGDVKTSIRRSIKTGLDASDMTFDVQCDLWFVEEKSWGAALCYATGSKEHNVALRTIASEQGIKINEYGYFKEKSGRRLGGSTEKELYELLDLPYYPPELREGTKLYNKVPRLLRMKDLTCDMHHHSQWSHDAEGSYTILTAAKAAKAAGLDVLSITDHSYAPSFKKEGALKRFVKECRAAEKATNIRVLAGVECDIMRDGTLQWSDDDLEQLDVVIAAIHKKHDENVQDRLVAAIKHPKVDIIAHPTGRLFGRREIPDDVDWKEVFRVAAKRNVAMEINGGDGRLDLPADLISIAAKKGCKFTLSSDSHNGGHIEHSLGNALTQARRAGLQQKHLYRVP